MQLNRRERSQPSPFRDVETGRALGREEKAVQLPEAAWQNALEAMGTPADRTGLYIEMVKSFNGDWIYFGNSGTEVPWGDDYRGVRTGTGQVRRLRTHRCDYQKRR